MTCFSAFFTEKDGKSCFGTGKRWEKLFLRQKHDLTRKQHAEHPFAGRNTQHSCLVQGGLLLVESGLWFWNKVVKVEYYWKCNKFSNWSLIAEVEICRFQISRVKKIVFSTVFTLEGLIPVWAKHTGYTSFHKYVINTATHLGLLNTKWCHDDDCDILQESSPK